MARKHKNYQTGKIYCIRSYSKPEIYIGSTTQTLAQRLTQHRSDFKRWLKGTKKYNTSFEVLSDLAEQDYYIELIELCPCSCDAELKRRELQLIRTMDCVNKKQNNTTPITVEA